MKCLTEVQILDLVDGGIAPNERAALDGHLAGCARCRTARQDLEELVGDLAALPELDEDVHVKGIMGRLDEERPIARTTRRIRWGRAAPLASALAIAAGALLLARTGPSHREDPAFTARGGGSRHTLARDVGVRVLSGTKTLTPLTAGATVEPDAAFTAAFTNVRDTPAYLLLFAIDAKGEVHWLYPAYASTQENPGALALRPSTTEVPMGTSVLLEDVAPGPLRILSIVTEQPLHVLDIEGTGPGALARDALARSYPDALVTELDVRVAGPQ